jgi:glutathione S-transferase
VFGQVPVFEENGKKLYQSKAILRHLARGLELTGKTEEESYHIDMVFEHLADIRRAFSQLVYSNEFDSKKEQYTQTTLPQLLKTLETLLDGRHYITGDNISFADYTLYELFDINAQFVPEILTNFPNLAAHKTRIESRPGIKDYIANRRPKYINGYSASFGGWKKE